MSKRLKALVLAFRAFVKEALEGLYCLHGVFFFVARGAHLIKYYATMFVDFVLRFIWILEIYMTGFIQPAYSNILFAVLEIL